MSNAPAQLFPRRDVDGRVVSLAELLLAGLAGTALGLAGLALIDGVLSTIGLGEFGQASGWLVSILPALLYFDELRAWRPYGVRLLVAAVAAGVGIGLGLIAAAIVNTWPPILSGTVGAAVAVLAYAPIWFVGVRWLTGHLGERRSA
ncbi:MAG TPA: hypothetical protein VF163_18005 [Micromonosporaceae bacterium]